MIKLNYKEFGEGSPVIILHGIFGMLDNWKTFGRKLSSDFRVFLVDQRDHGRSPHTEEFNYPILAEDLNDFIEEHQLGKVRLIGHSMGGKVIMEFARSYAEKIEQMIVVDMGIRRYRGGHEEILEALAELPLTEIHNRKEAELRLSKRIDSQGVVLFLMKNLSRNTDGGYEWKLNLPLISASYAELMAHDLTDSFVSEVNVLFVKGGNSNYIREKDQAAIVNVFPNALISEIANAGHWVHAEQPNELEIKIRSYFNAT